MGPALGGWIASRPVVEVAAWRVERCCRWRACRAADAVPSSVSSSSSGTCLARRTQPLALHIGGGRLQVGGTRGPKESCRPDGSCDDSALAAPRQRGNDTCYTRLQSDKNLVPPSPAQKLPGNVRQGWAIQANGCKPCVSLHLKPTWTRTGAPCIIIVIRQAGRCACTLYSLRYGFEIRTCLTA